MVLGPVTGLGSGALVRLNGIEIGRVTGIEMDPQDPQLVRVILQVRNAVEIRTDAVASLETIGLTGVSYIEISGGTLNSPALVVAEGQQYPTIRSRPSSLPTGCWFLNVVGFCCKPPWSGGFLRTSANWVRSRFLEDPNV